MKILLRERSHIMSDLGDIFLAKRFNKSRVFYHGAVADPWRPSYSGHNSGKKAARRSDTKDKIYLIFESPYYLNLKLCIVPT